MQTNKATEKMVTRNRIRSENVLNGICTLHTRAKEQEQLLGKVDFVNIGVV